MRSYFPPMVDDTAGDAAGNEEARKMRAIPVPGAGWQRAIPVPGAGQKPAILYFTDGSDDRGTIRAANCGCTFFCFSR
jgi:hypothetical protein